MGKLSELHHLLLSRYASVKVAKTGFFSLKWSVHRESRPQLNSLKSVSAMTIESHKHSQRVSARCVEFLPRCSRQKIAFLILINFRALRRSSIKSHWYALFSCGFRRKASSHRLSKTHLNAMYFEDVRDYHSRFPSVTH